MILIFILLGYWTYEKWRNALPQDDTFTTNKRSSEVSSSPITQQFKEIKIDTSKLYNELISALNKQDTLKLEQDPDRRGKVSTAPSIRNFDLDGNRNTVADDKPSQHRQFISSPINIQTSAPSTSVGSLDPFSTVTTTEESANQIAANTAPAAVPTNPVQSFAPAPPAPAASSYNVQSYDAEVIPDGNGGMKILDTQPVQNSEPIISSALTKQPSIGHPSHENVINNPRNTEHKEESSKKEKHTEKEKSSSKEVSANRRVYSLGDHSRCLLRNFSIIQGRSEKQVRSVKYLRKVLITNKPVKIYSVSTSELFISYSCIFRGTAKFSEEIINKNIMTQLNVILLLMLSTMYFAVVLNTPM